jgi:hypothetical protein
MFRKPSGKVTRLFTWGGTIFLICKRSLPMKAMLFALVAVIFAVAIAPLGQLASQSRGDLPKKQEEKKKKAMIEWGPEKNGVRCAVTLCPVVWADPADKPSDELLCGSTGEGIRGRDVACAVCYQERREESGRCNLRSPLLV